MHVRSQCLCKTWGCTHLIWLGLYDSWLLLTCIQRARVKSKFFKAISSSPCYNSQTTKYELWMKHLKEKPFIMLLILVFIINLDSGFPMHLDFQFSLTICRQTTFQNFFFSKFFKEALNYGNTLKIKGIV